MPHQTGDGSFREKKKSKSFVNSGLIYLNFFNPGPGFKSYGQKKDFLVHNSAIFCFWEKNYTSRHPKSSKNNRGLLSEIFL